MSILDQAPTITAAKPPRDVRERLQRGRDRMRDRAPGIRECLEFWRGNQYAYVNADNYLIAQGMVSGSGQGKPRHRMRTVRNVLVDAVENEVSTATQRVPSYQVIPSTIDPAAVQAAFLAQKIARYGYDKWDLRSVRERVVTYAVVTGEGFAWPYWDAGVGSPVDPEAGVSTGEVSVRVYGPNEVYWEPGIRFEQSRWHAVEQARSIDEVTSAPGYTGGKLEPDAIGSGEMGNEGARSRLVLVTEYLERPSAPNPQGRRVVIANNRVIQPVTGYPCVDGDGQVVDEPCLHRLSRLIDPASDRDWGLVKHALWAQRTINDVQNRALEWKNLALNPQILAPVGSIRQRITDEPGAVIQYIPVAGQVPQWRQPPAIPSELFTLKEQAQADIGALFAQNQIPSQVSAAQAVQSLLDRDQNRRAAFVSRVVEWDSRLMRHCLYLVQRYYTESRLVKLRGRFGWESIQAFRGADLRGQADVQVLPQSVEPRTKEQIEQRVMNYAQLGWVDPVKAMAAIEHGTTDELIEEYELDYGKACRMIRKIEQLSDSQHGKPAPGADVPLPDQFDNPAVMKHVLSQYAKTEDAEQLAPAAHEALVQLINAYDQMDQQRQAQQAQQQAATAQQAGMNNAAAPTAQGKPMPSLPKTSRQPNAAGR